jgi:hypothetical protein
VQLKSLYIILVILLSICSYIIVNAQGNTMKITEDQAIKIANKEAKNLGYSVETMSLKVAEYNTPWNDYLHNNSKSEYVIGRQEKLKNKKYWAIYFYPNPKIQGAMVKGGDLCIFVNSINGEIITTVRGK